MAYKFLGMIFFKFFVMLLLRSKVVGVKISCALHFHRRMVKTYAAVEINKCIVRMATAYKVTQSFKDTKSLENQEYEEQHKDSWQITYI